MINIMILISILTNNKWEIFENDKYTFITFVTHECRSSIRKDILAPFTRFNDKYMTAATVKSWSKCTQLKLAAKIGEGKHFIEIK